MRSWPASAARWVRGLIGQKTPAPRFPGTDTAASGGDAVLALAGLAADVIVRVRHGEDAPQRGLDDSAPLDVLNAFGRAVTETFVDSASDALGAGVGATLTGLRTAVFVSSDELSTARELLDAAVIQQAPVVVHVACRPALGRGGAAGSAHGALHAIADSGAIVLVARHVQHAVDLAQVAHRVAELALLPVVVASDAAAIVHSVQDVALPEVEQVVELLGDPGAVIDAATPFQRVMLGNTRRRVPRAFDPDHPVARGGLLSAAEHLAAQAGRQTFVAAHAAELLTDCFAALSRATGRPLGLVQAEGLDKARIVIVAQGAAADVARATAEAVRKQKARVGVVAVDVLAPWPVEALRTALEGARKVLVLEQSLEPLRGSGPLKPAVAESIAAESVVVDVFAGVAGELPDPTDLAALLARAADGELADPIWLGVGPLTAKSRFPKREVVVQALRAQYAELDDHLVTGGEAVSLRPAGAMSLSVTGRASAVSADVIAHLAGKLSRKRGKHIRSQSTLGASGIVEARLVLAGSPVAALDFDDVDFALVAGVDVASADNVPANVKEGGVIAFATALLPQDLWNVLPAAWRGAIRQRKLSVYGFDGDLRGLVDQVARILDDKLDRVRIVDWARLAEPAVVSVDDAVPGTVRRFGGAATGPDSVARYWSEVVQPRREGEGKPDAVEPWAALGAQPPHTAVFHDHAGSFAALPSINSSACTGCGRCWTACPDAAIGATALTVEQLLDSAATRAVDPTADPDPVREKLKRSHKQLASRIVTMLAKDGGGIARPEVLRESYGWLVDKMKVSEAERAGFDAAFEATFEVATELEWALTEPFFTARNEASKGNGALLALAVNPQSCKACGVCAAVCEDDAIALQPVTTQSIAAARATWSTWEQLPDTAGELVAFAADRQDVGRMGAILTSRHCQLAMTGGDPAEPGSGQRLAVRLAAGVAEFHAQRALVAQLDVIGGLVPRLRDAVRKMFVDALPMENLTTLDAALVGLGNRNVAVGKVVSQLAGLGERTDIDGRRVQSLVRVTRALEEARHLIAEGAHGTGRARFGLVLTGESVVSWAGRAPLNPFSGPVLVDLGRGGACLAQGVAEGLLARRVAEVRLERHAQLLLSPPSDLPAREEALDRLTWRDLTADELASATPVLLVGGAELLVGDAFAGVARLLACGLPVKVVILDDGDLTATRVDPVSLALAQRDVFVLSGSLAHAAHLASGLEAAFGYAGAALVHVLAPSPRGNGFGAESLIQVAADAVEARVHPLLRYDPSGEGVYGSRMSLAGNPAEGELWSGKRTPAHWALGQRRFASHFSPADGVDAVDVRDWAESRLAARQARAATVVDETGATRVLSARLAAACGERLARWRMLQELAGVVTPFAARVRVETAAALETEHAAELATLRSKHAAELAEVESRQMAEQAARLKARLLQLAGFSTTGLAD